MIVKPKKCKQCKATFTPRTSTQVVCSWQCAIEYGKKQTTKQLNQDTRRRKEAAKPQSKWFVECKAIAQKYARVRDSHLGCISCDKPANWGGQWHGSHFRPAGNNKAVALNLLNIHKACSECNNFKSGNLITYQDRLIEKIGKDKVDWLKSQNQTHRHSIEYLKRYKAVMGKRLRQLEKRKG